MCDILSAQRHCRRAPYHGACGLMLECNQWGIVGLAGIGAIREHWNCELAANADASR